MLFTPTRFVEYRLGYRLSPLRLFVVFLSSSRLRHGKDLEQVTTASVHLFQLIIH
jgi:hypothetical protein